MNGFVIDEEADHERRSTEGIENKSEVDQVLATERVERNTKQIDVETLTGDLDEIRNE
jgi:hypothetical protein